MEPKQQCCPAGSRLNGEAKVCVCPWPDSHMTPTACSCALVTVREDQAAGPAAIHMAHLDEAPALSLSLDWCQLLQASTSTNQQMESQCPSLPLKDQGNFGRVCVEVQRGKPKLELPI